MAVDESIILKLILKKLKWIVYTSFIWLWAKTGIRLFKTRSGSKLIVWESVGVVPPFLTKRPLPLYRLGRASGIRVIGGWVGSKLV
jgi:hypothetical protein